MRYRRLGKTDLNISVLGFGASPLGDVYGRIEMKRASQAVALAIEEGINFFDVSPYYGLTLAEERLGQALAGKREKVVLTTKCGRYGLEDFDFSAQRVRSSLEESLQRLHTDHVDLLLAHDVEFGDPQQVIGETIPAMRRLQEEGKTRYVGVSGYPLKVLARIAEEAEVDSLLSYCHYNLLIDDLKTDLMPFAEERGLGVINASPLHMGMLTESGPPAWHPAPPEVVEASRQAFAFCRAHGVDLSLLAIRYCLDYPAAASTLVGMSEPEQVCRNLRALEPAVDEDFLDQVKAILSPASNVVWHSGRPDGIEAAG